MWREEKAERERRRGRRGFEISVVEIVLFGTKRGTMALC